MNAPRHPNPARRPLVETDADVLAYVRDHAWCTARDVARELLGGTGDTRTRQRNTAAASLDRLRDEGKVRREPDATLPRGSKIAYRWALVDEGTSCR